MDMDGKNDFITDLEHKTIAWHREKLWKKHKTKAAVAMAAKNAKCSQLFALLVDKKTIVPFQQAGDKPVYFRECFVTPTRNQW